MDEELISEITIEETVIAKLEPQDTVDFPLPHVEEVAYPSDRDVSSTSEQVNQFCRLCLHDFPLLFPLTARVRGILIPAMIETVTGIRLDLQDKFPKKLCIQCITKLDYAYNIREEFIASDKALRDLAKSKTNSLVQNLTEYQNGLLAKTETYAEKLLNQNRDIIRLRSIREEEPIVNLNSTEITEELDEIESSLKQVEECQQIVEQDNNKSLTLNKTLQEEQLANLNSTGITEELEVETPLKQFEECQQTVEQDNNESLPTNKTPQKEKALPRKKLRRYNIDTKEKKLDPNKCYICKKKFTNANDLSMHLSHHVGMIPYKCKKCPVEEGEPQKIVTLIMLHRHFRMHASPIKCPDCSFRTCTIAVLYAHMQRHHSDLSNAALNCKVCGVKITDKRTYGRHMRMHKAIDEGRYSCRFCEKRFATKTRLTRHERSHTNEKPYQCRYCSKAFINDTSFHSHERIHTGEKGYRCELCGKSFRAKTPLKVHVESVHAVPGQPKKRREPKNQTLLEPIKCEYKGCRFETTNPKKYYSHRTMHALKYHCSHCEKRFSSKQRLEQHKLTHTGQKPLCCEVCGKSYRYKKTFQEHMDGHSDNRP